MRKLLIASQKGGVGKTTTALNLAAVSALAGQRTLILDADPLGSMAACLKLRRDLAAPPAAGINRPGNFWTGVLPNLDVYCPYRQGSFSEDDLTDGLAYVPRLIDRGGYNVMVIDSPPSLWQRSRRLLGEAHELILVLRAEPLAFRTLPSYLEMLRAGQAPGGASRLRGILLTLPPSVKPGGELEREMQSKFASRALPEAIPHDPDVGHAQLMGKPVVSVRPHSAAAQAFLRLGKYLKLANDIEAITKSCSGPAPIATVPAFQLQPQELAMPAWSPSNTEVNDDTPLPMNNLFLDPAAPLGETRYKPRHRWAWLAKLLPWARA